MNEALPYPNTIIEMKINSITDTGNVIKFNQPTIGGNGQILHIDTEGKTYWENNSTEFLLKHLSIDGRNIKIESEQDIEFSPGSKIIFSSSAITNNTNFIEFIYC